MKLKGGVTNRLQNAEQELPQVIKIATETADNEFLFFFHCTFAWRFHPILDTIFITGLCVNMSTNVYYKEFGCTVHTAVQL